MAMEDIVFNFIGTKDPEKAKHFLQHFVELENNQYSYQNCFVAEVEKEVVAAVNIYDGAMLATLRQPVIEYIRKYFSIDMAIEDETDSGEYYLDSIAVSISHRGRGLGTTLLQFVIDEYANKEQKPLGLLVDKNNLKAKMLYLKLGFESVREINFMGKPYEHLQKNTPHRDGVGIFS
jgi:ribosomal protein S18 acetylase RimI-like enzyme